MSTSQDSWASCIQKTQGSLKDFQVATVDVVHRRMFVEGQKNMLIADEVGLGKTIVAKGVIAKELMARKKAGTRKPLKVTYICSNQVIASENIQKLNLFPEQAVVERETRRIAYLAYAPKPKKDAYSKTLTLNTLTPGTSFNPRCYPGVRKERSIVYALLCGDERLDAQQEGVACLVRGSVEQKPADWEWWLEDMRKLELRKGLQERFLGLASRKILPLKYDAVYQLLGTKKPVKLLEAAVSLSDFLTPVNEKVHRTACNELVSVLRQLMIECCMSYVDADLYILDEFQRFRGLIDSSNKAEASQLAQKVFKQKKSKVLLLSATPFKAYTGDLEQANGEDHFEDFQKILHFLLNEDVEVLNSYNTHRRELYRQLLSLDKETPSVSTEHREAVEDILRQVMCRTERNSVSTDPNAMIDDQWKKAMLPFSINDIHNFTQTDRLAQTLSRIPKTAKHTIGAPVEYCKSAPYPLSFLDGYQFKKDLKKHRTEPEVQKVLESTPGAWLNTEAIHSYELKLAQGAGSHESGGVAHARLNQLIDAAVGAKGASLLWIPPSLPYYPMEGAFKGADKFSKTLVFSAWVMVPRMIASLVSYEVERQTVGNPLTRDQQEAQPRTYFAPDDEKKHRRHPVPQLTFSVREQGGGEYAASMSNFCLLYPSPTLAALVTIPELLNGEGGLDKILPELSCRIRGVVEELNLQKYEQSTGSDEKWYWVSTLLLDRGHKGKSQLVETWLDEVGPDNEESLFSSKEKDQRGKRFHLDVLRQAFREPEKMNLGRMPDDLCDVLADMALGSPAVVALRSLSALYSEGQYLTTDLNDAALIAGQFVNLYNKPESITAIRLTTDRSSYWREAIIYGCCGCLQAVMDEYLHLLMGQQGSRKKVIRAFEDTVNISTASINVDGHKSFIEGKPLKMRCHYGVSFGNQKIETEKGEERASNIRGNFNSPFRPFVLATTSIGQEGLDFHQYCRRIVHWNLPGNPIDLEQREGRINRYKGLVVRQQLAVRYADALRQSFAQGDPWEHLFELADISERQSSGKCELIPYWHTDTNEVAIERMIPMYPFSQDQVRLERILKTLTIYRLAFGQPRQVELVEHLLAKDFSPEEIGNIREKLMINLSPIVYQSFEPNNPDVESRQ
ncbi:DEAD/DEAH box helicase [Kiritimatiellota bacterium B12222]|nr:DEAD/DEAH box helicase [Kiritimatiellota bacterium B12222]